MHIANYKELVENNCNVLEMNNDKSDWQKVEIAKRLFLKHKIIGAIRSNLKCFQS